jgi:hypothetical protein
MDLGMLNREERVEEPPALDDVAPPEPVEEEAKGGAVENAQTVGTAQAPR